MPKTKVTKSRISITIDKRLLEELKKECGNRTMKLSSYLEKLVKKGYEDEGKQVK